MITISTQPATERFAAAGQVAAAVLYEGYVLYPYRASAQKNRMRWQFGVLAPRSYAEATRSERSSMRTEVIVAPGDRPRLVVQIRLLHVQRRIVEATSDGGESFMEVDALLHGGRTVVTWDEAQEHAIDLEPILATSLVACPVEHRFALAGGEETELLRDASGATVGRVVRRRESVHGRVRLAAARCDGDDAPPDRPSERPLLKLTIDVENSTGDDDAVDDRESVMRRSLVAVHTLLAVDDARFISMLEPEPFAEAAVASCRNDGTFPVLIGQDEQCDVMLSSPIILYDFPAIAPESAGDFCDATEIDEILALRVLTLTDEEKAEARGTDPRAAAIVDRCDDLPDEIWSRLHGAVRALRPVEKQPADVPWWDPDADSAFDPFTGVVRVGGVDVTSGTRVRLKPSRRADAHDLFYAGQQATVKGVFDDVEGARHVAVTLDDDPAGDLFDWQGRYLFFHPDEIEVLP